MKTLAYRAIVVVAIGLAVWAGVWANGGVFGFSWWSWHQKLTVDVQTPAGVKTASSVSEGSWEIAPTWFKIGDSGGGHGEGWLKGEAVVLELAPQKYLFALLSHYSAETAIQVFANPPLRTDNRREYIPALERIASSSDSSTLSAEHYPLLVTFDDINDPASVKRVDPANLEAAFGAGYRLNSITLSLTDEPVTKGKVEKVLPIDFFRRWADLYHNALAQGGIANSFFNTFAASLGRDDFTTK